MHPNHDREETDRHTIHQGFAAIRAANGGWIVTSRPDGGPFAAVQIGAFTNDDDLIDFVIAELKPESRTVEHITGTEFSLDPEAMSKLARDGGGKPDGE